MADKYPAGYINPETRRPFKSLNTESEDSRPKHFQKCQGKGFTVEPGGGMSFNCAACEMTGLVQPRMTVMPPESQDFCTECCSRATVMIGDILRCALHRFLNTRK